MLNAVDQSIIYAYPTITSLSRRLIDIYADPDTLEVSEDHLDTIQKLIGKYTFEYVLRSSTANVDNKRAVILLTGSTGHLGSHIMASLLRDPQISMIYTLNRFHVKGLSSRDRHRNRFIEEGLDATLLDSTKLIQIEGDYEKENLGVSEVLYTEVCSVRLVEINSLTLTPVPALI